MDQLIEEFGRWDRSFKREVSDIRRKLINYVGTEHTFRVRDATEIIRSMRKEPPAHYLFEIDFFPSFLRSHPNRAYFDSTEFDVGGHKWVLSIYPDGKDDDSKDCISLYLKLVKRLDQGRSVNAICKFFVYDYIRQMYLVVQDLGVQCFDDIEKERGISRVLSLGDFAQASNGFFVNGRCMFGVEVNIISTTTQTAGLRALDVRRSSAYTWAIENFSNCVKNEYAYSEEFAREGRSWKLLVYPKGHGSGKGKSLSLYLSLVDCSNLTNGTKLFAEIVLRLKNLRNEPDRIQMVTVWYTSSTPSWGHDNIALLSDLHNPEKGFRLDDTVIVEVELKQLHQMIEESPVGMAMVNYQG